MYRYIVCICFLGIILYVLVEALKLEIRVRKESKKWLEESPQRRIKYERKKEEQFIEFKEKLYIYLLEKLENGAKVFIDKKNLFFFLTEINDGEFLGREEYRIRFGDSNNYMDYEVGIETRYTHIIEINSLSTRRGHASACLYLLEQNSIKNGSTAIGGWAKEGGGLSHEELLSFYKVNGYQILHRKYVDNFIKERKDFLNVPSVVRWIKDKSALYDAVESCAKNYKIKSPVEDIKSLFNRETYID